MGQCKMNCCGGERMEGNLNLIDENEDTYKGINFYSKKRTSIEDMIANDPVLSKRLVRIQSRVRGMLSRKKYQQSKVKGATSNNETYDEIEKSPELIQQDGGNEDISLQKKLRSRAPQKRNEINENIAIKDEEVEQSQQKGLLINEEQKGNEEQQLYANIDFQNEEEVEPGQQQNLRSKAPKKGYEIQQDEENPRPYEENKVEAMNMDVGELPKNQGNNNVLFFENNLVEENNEEMQPTKYRSAKPKQNPQISDNNNESENVNDGQLNSSAQRKNSSFKNKLEDFNSSSFANNQNAISNSQMKRNPMRRGKSLKMSYGFKAEEGQRTFLRRSSLVGISGKRCKVSEETKDSVIDDYHQKYN